MVPSILLGAIVPLVAAGVLTLPFGFDFFHVLIVGAWIFCGLFLVGIIQAITENRRLLGPAWLPLSRYNLRLLPASEMVVSEATFLAFRSVVLMSAWAIGHWTRASYTSWFVLLISADTLFTVFLRLRPPVILVLTNSTVVAGDFLTEIHHQAGYLRTVALLRVDRMSKNAQQYGMLLLIRMSASRDWRSVIETLSGLVPIILVDCRHLSEGLQFEARRMIQADRVYKTVFIVEPRRDAPVLEDAVATMTQSPARLCAAMLDECVPLVKKMLKSRATLPQFSHDAEAILSEYRIEAQKYVEL